MSCRRTTVTLTHDESRFIERNYMSLTKIMHARLSVLMLKQKEKGRQTFDGETIPYTPKSQREDVCYVITSNGT